LAIFYWLAPRAGGGGTFSLDSSQPDRVSADSHCLTLA
jgi:hypothetical protein